MPEEKSFDLGYEQNMVSLIHNMTKIYQERAIQQGNPKINSLQDISKLGNGFYDEMLNHKNHRLEKRKEVVFQTIPLAPLTADHSQY